jgi:hypothetical protein
MARKTLLSEGEIRQFMKLANLNPLAETYISNHSGLTTEQDEEELEVGGAMEIEEEPPLDMDAMDDEMPPEEGGGEEDLVVSLLQAVQDWAEEHGVDMSLDGDEGGEEIEDVEAIEMGDDGGMDMEMDMEMGAEEEEVPGGMDMYEEGAAEKAQPKADDDDEKEEKPRRQSAGSKARDRMRDRHSRRGMGVKGVTSEGDAAEKRDADKKDDDDEEPRRKSAGAKARDRMRDRHSRRGVGIKGVTSESDVTEALVAEVAQRVMERLSGTATKTAKRDEIAAQLAERIFKRLAQD